jgi:hypothetical protein
MWSKHSDYMEVIGKFPALNAMATWHDNWLNNYPIPRLAWDYFLRFTPGHAIGYSVALSAYYASTNPAYYGRLH